VYDKDDLRSFMTLFRKLIAEKEPTNLYRVTSMLGRYVTEEERTTFREARKRLKEGEKSFGGIHLTVGGGGEPEEFSPKRVLDTLFNADIFHSDMDKQPALRKLELSPSHVLLLIPHVVGIVRLALDFAEAIRFRGYIR